MCVHSILSLVLHPIKDAHQENDCRTRVPTCDSLQSIQSCCLHCRLTSPPYGSRLSALTPELLVLLGV